MRHGDHGHMWINLFHEDQVIYDLALSCKDMGSANKILLSNGFILVEHIGNSFKYANDNHVLIAVYYFMNEEFTITIDKHGFPNAKALKKCWDFCDELAQMSPLEIQTYGD